MTYYTFKKVALAHKAVWQKLRFLAGKGYYLIGTKPAPVVDPEPKHDTPFTHPVTPPAPKPVVQPSVMFDSINVTQIPKDAAAVAGYVGGRWPTYPTLEKLFPSAVRLSIAIASYEDADVLDVENGDATNETAPAWYRRQLARGVKRPKLYTSLSNVMPLVHALKVAGFVVPLADVWSAHYTDKAHICGPSCGYGLTGSVGATQWTSHALGRTLDQSLVGSGFFNTDV